MVNYFDDNNKEANVSINFEDFEKPKTSQDDEDIIVKIKELDYFVPKQDMRLMRSSSLFHSDAQAEQEMNSSQNKLKINYWLEKLAKNVFIQSDHQIDFKNYGI